MAKSNTPTTWATPTKEDHLYVWLEWMLYASIGDRGPRGMIVGTAMSALFSISWFGGNNVLALFFPPFAFDDFIGVILVVLCAILHLVGWVWLTLRWVNNNNIYRKAKDHRRKKNRRRKR